MAVKICPKCKGKVSETRNICPHCNYNFNKRIIVCPDCDSEVEEGISECPVCGYYFDATDDSSDDVDVVGAAQIPMAKVETEKADTNPSNVYFANFHRSMSKEQFLRTALIGLTLDADTPADILSSELVEIKESEIQGYLITGQANGYYSGLIGIGSNEECIIDWKPYTGQIINKPCEHVITQLEANVYSKTYLQKDSDEDDDDDDDIYDERYKKLFWDLFGRDDLDKIHDERTDNEEISKELYNKGISILHNKILETLPWPGDYHKNEHRNIRIDNYKVFRCSVPIYEAKFKYKDCFCFVEGFAVDQMRDVLVSGVWHKQLENNKTGVIKKAKKSQKQLKQQSCMKYALLKQELDKRGFPELTDEEKDALQYSMGIDSLDDIDDTFIFEALDTKNNKEEVSVTKKESGVAFTPKSGKSKSMKQNLAFAILLVLNTLFTLTFLTFTFMRNFNFMEVYFTMPLRYFPVLIIGIGSVVMEIIGVIHLLTKQLTEKINKMLCIVMLLNIVVCPFLIVDNILYAANRGAEAFEYLIIFSAFLVLCISAVCSHLLLSKAKKEQWRIYKSKVLFYVVTLILSVAFVAVHMFALSSEKVMLNKFNQELTAISYFGETPKEIIIPDGVTSIGERAFIDCTDLTSITIPDSVTSIGGFAFFGCDGLTRVVIPDSVEIIKYGAFGDCASLKSITLSADHSIEDIVGPWSHPEFEEVNIIIGPSTSSINSFKEYATNVTILEGVTSIEDSTFSDFKNLTSIIIPDSVTSIGDNAFYGCRNLTSITIPDSVMTIGDSAFSGCTNLTSITIPDSITTIGDSAFSGCANLTSVTIPDSVTSIGEEVFWGCDAISEITLPFIGTTEYGSFTTQLGNIFGHVGWAQDNSDVPSSLKKVIITSATEIGDYAFYNCSSIESITIPESVTIIGYEAFAECTSLVSIKYGGTVEEWKAITKGSSWNYNTGSYTITYNYTRE